MRILVKGGVWKNTEDEILKAAVMKYGLNQWARISSLLVRKSAKQCKARWYEWLDPSIKKTEWSREEEEKLLHLAKLMPTQWRTIAPIVGRTASQCLEHYEKLLDAAQGKDASLDPSEDPRRLRPGEIDPQPEVKPARPDPVDMDEDEKEMLSEARARLANTRGKKAKRKAREKQLEEARRLASLQKRRELKAAGINLPVHRRKMKGMDYNKEIPFLKKIPAGFYDTSTEIELEKKKRQDPSYINIALQRLEAKRRDEEEERARKKDSRKQAIKKMKDLPAAIMQINKLNDPAQIRQRSRLQLPSPQVTDEELEQIAKLGYVPSEIDADVAQADESEAPTKMLLGDYSATPMATPMRTPAFGGAPTAGGVPMRTPLRDLRTPSRQDVLLSEAQNLIALTSSETPLKGGENTPLHPSDFSGATPKRHEVQTPNVLATPLRTPRGGPEAGMTPRRGKAGAATPSSRAALTPLRDQLHINEEGVGDPRASIKAQLKAGLDALPAPKNEYTLVMPQLPTQEDEREDAAPIEPDAEDLLAEQRAIERQKQEMRQRMRSQVLKRELPRPLAINKAFVKENSSVRQTTKQTEMLESEEDYLALADEMVMDEMLAMVGYDALHYPMKGAKPVNPAQLQYEEMTEEELAAAARLLREEVDQLRTLHGKVEDDVYSKILERVEGQMMYVPAERRYVRREDLSREDQLAALTAHLHNLHTQAKRDGTRAAKLEKKLNLYNGGYQNRASALVKEIDELLLKGEQARLELDCFKELRKMEVEAVPRRVAALRQQVEEVTARENSLQIRYANLLSQIQG
jgi:pre-mRNA-splicing factor CDC5/CEF1